MRNDEEIRKAGTWTITQSLHIGDKEVVFGEDKENTQTPYMCGFCQTNELMRGYSDCIGGDDYLEIMQLYAERINEQIEVVKEEIAEIPYPTEPITAGLCYPNDLSKSINGKIVALKAEVLRSEYQIATHQILLVNGGFGAAANSRGSAVFVTNLYSGAQYRVERREVLGEIKPGHLPHWALEKAAQMKEREKSRLQPER
ncbi:MAG: hypothetical protein VB034_00710 [Eubacteriales bacterium]|nr:hypothetical protein [Eubacteriales bacterium]